MTKNNARALVERKTSWGDITIQDFLSYVLFSFYFLAEKLQVLVICEGKNGKITCENGKKISILDANYGRLDRDTCLHSAMSNVNCRSGNSLQIMKDKCNGKTECELLAASSVFGGDPCGGTYKYLQVKYRCLEL